MWINVMMVRAFLLYIKGQVSVSAGRWDLKRNVTCGHGNSPLLSFSTKSG
jgi:hypothetical protein